MILVQKAELLNYHRQLNMTRLVHIINWEEFTDTQPMLVNAEYEPPDNNLNQNPEKYQNVNSWII